MELDYELEVMPFPPRYLHKEFMAVNPLGTIPYFIDGAAHMTESSGICHYLVEKYEKYEFGLKPQDAEYGAYLNWLYHSDATLTFPQTIFLRYSKLEPEERRQPVVAQDYRKWYLARLRLLDAHLENREFLCDDRFTIADIAIGYALYLGQSMEIDTDYQPQTRAYLERLKDRPGFHRAQEAQKI